MPRHDAFEDRGQSMRPANAKAGARNQGGFHNAPSAQKVKPPPVSRARKDSVLRPIADGGSSQGSIRSSATKARSGGMATKARSGGMATKARSGGMSSVAPPERVSAPRKRGGGPPPSPPGSRRGPQQEIEGQEFGLGQDRSQKATTTRSHAKDLEVGPPVPRKRDGSPMADPGMGLAPEQEPTPGAAPDGGGQEAVNQAELPPSSPANAGARAPQSPAELGQPVSESGNPIPTPDAEPPQNDPAVSGGQPLPEESAAAFNESVGAAGPDSFGGRMGEDLLGFKIEGSDQIANGKEWKGEIGPGMPSNQQGALGIPGQQNSPEDVAFNRGRFDAALEQNKGDKHAAAMSAGAFPSGNPIAHGTMTHMDRLVNSTDGDGVDSSQMDEGTRRRYKADAVRQTEEYGAYPGMDDPDSPSPPIRPMSWSFNPHTNKMVSPEGRESYIDRFGGKGE